MAAVQSVGLPWQSQGSPLPPHQTATLLCHQWKAWRPLRQSPPTSSPSNSSSPRASWKCPIFHSTWHMGRTPWVLRMQKKKRRRRALKTAARRCRVGMLSTLAALPNGCSNAMCKPLNPSQTECGCNSAMCKPLIPSQTDFVR